MKTSPVPTD